MVFEMKNILEMNGQEIIEYLASMKEDRVVAFDRKECYFLAKEDQLKKEAGFYGIGIEEMEQLTHYFFHEEFEYRKKLFNSKKREDQRYYQGVADGLNVAFRELSLMLANLRAKKTLDENPNFMEDFEEKMEKFRRTTKEPGL